MVLKDNYTEKQLHNLGERFKKLRKENGFSNYEHFAYENDLSRSQYGRYENGEDLRFSSLLRVLKAMDISLKDFFSEGFE